MEQEEGGGGGGVLFPLQSYFELAQGNIAVC